METLYMKDPYAKEFETKITETSGSSVVLDSTIFYPDSGGQPSDTGTMISSGKTFSVVSVRKENGKIIHGLDKEGLNAGDAVVCKINWDRRYTLMRMHTAAHLLSAVTNRSTGALVTGKQLGTERSRIDFSLDDFDKSKIHDYAKEANRLIEKGASVKSFFMRREEVMGNPGMMRLADKMPPDVPELRIVEIGGIDKQACGGTHVKDIREIGKISVLKAENKGKSNRRMYYIIE